MSPTPRSHLHKKKAQDHVTAGGQSERALIRTDKQKDSHTKLLPPPDPASLYKMKTSNVAARPRTVISRLVVIVWDIQNFFAAAAVKEWRKLACFKVWCGNVVCGGRWFSVVGVLIIYGGCWFMFGFHRVSLHHSSRGRGSAPSGALTHAGSSRDGGLLPVLCSARC